MDWFRKLPGYRRAPAGFEWVLWRHLPRLIGWGTILPVGAALLLRYSALGSLVCDSDATRDVLLYALAGLVGFLWTAAGTVAIGCIVVMIMKGPAYAADPFPEPAAGDPAQRDAHG